MLVLSTHQSSWCDMECRHNAQWYFLYGQRERGVFNVEEKVSGITLRQWDNYSEIVKSMDPGDGMPEFKSRLPCLLAV